MKMVSTILLSDIFIYKEHVMKKDNQATQSKPQKPSFSLIDKRVSYGVLVDTFEVYILGVLVYRTTTVGRNGI